MPGNVSEGPVVAEDELHHYARRARREAGLAQEEAAKELGVGQPSISRAERTPERSYTNLRLRMILTFGSRYRGTEGPLFRLLEK